MDTSPPDRAARIPDLTRRFGAACSFLARAHAASMPLDVPAFLATTVTPEEVAAGLSVSVYEIVGKTDQPCDLLRLDLGLRPLEGTADRSAVYLGLNEVQSYDELTLRAAFHLVQDLPAAELPEVQLAFRAQRRCASVVGL